MSPAYSGWIGRKAWIGLDRWGGARCPPRNGSGAAVDRWPAPQGVFRGPPGGWELWGVRGPQRRLPKALEKDPGSTSIHLSTPGYPVGNTHARPRPPGGMHPPSTRMQTCTKVQPTVNRNRNRTNRLNPRPLPPTCRHRLRPVVTGYVPCHVAAKRALSGSYDSLAHAARPGGRSAQKYWALTAVLHFTQGSTPAPAPAAGTSTAPRRPPAPPPPCPVHSRPRRRWPQPPSTQPLAVAGPRDPAPSPVAGASGGGSGNERAKYTARRRWWGIKVLGPAAGGVRARRPGRRAPKPLPRGVIAPPPLRPPPSPRAPRARPPRSPPPRLLRLSPVGRAAGGGAGRQLARQLARDRASASPAPVRRGPRVG